MFFYKMYKFALWLKDSSWGGVIYSALDMLGVRIAIGRIRNYILNHKKQQNVTKEMRQSRKYFLEKKEQVKQIIKLLSDERSKDCYSRMVKFRCTYDHKVLPKNSYRSQYFGNTYFSYQDDEVFVDCGAFDGDTVKKLKKKMRKEGKTYKQIIAVEVDRRNCKNLSRNHPDCLIIRGGAWDKKEVLQFSTGQGENCQVQYEQSRDLPTEKIRAYALDKIAACRHATFIKMDIEGAEQYALRGFRHTIQTNKPKLAISIYHSDSDMIEIPLMLKEMVPSYKFYVMQHTNTACDTVLYATV